jgi:hypothetical protein
VLCKGCRSFRNPSLLYHFVNPRLFIKLFYGAFWPWHQFQNLINVKSFKTHWVQNSEFAVRLRRRNSTCSIIFSCKHINCQFRYIREFVYIEMKDLQLFPYHVGSCWRMYVYERWSSLRSPTSERLLPTYNRFFQLDCTLNGSLSILLWLAYEACDIAIE